MEYAKLINAIGACMQIDARCFTRYNKPVTQGDVGEETITIRDTKFCVVDYKDTEASFYLRAGQFCDNGKPMGMDDLIERFMKEDATLKIIDTAEEAVLSSIGEKYLVAVNDILAIAKGYVDNRETNCSIKLGTSINSSRDPGVVIFIACNDHTLVLTVRE